ncbi:hypothetical protein QQF64_011398 [Cirrhinus molitorella]|uniref:Uncharacterized protein n=1 Tax=Cirrhinus molitorella TaxID=172907 RepID=A0ABR3LZ38_9TELE
MVYPLKWTSLTIIAHLESPATASNKINGFLGPQLKISVHQMLAWTDLPTEHHTDLSSFAWMADCYYVL